MACFMDNGNFNQILSVGVYVTWEMCSVYTKLCIYIITKFSTAIWIDCLFHAARDVYDPFNLAMVSYWGQYLRIFRISYHISLTDIDFETGTVINTSKQTVSNCFMARKLSTVKLRFIWPVQGYLYNVSCEELWKGKNENFYNSASIHYSFVIQIRHKRYILFYCRVKFKLELNLI